MTDPHKRAFDKIVAAVARERGDSVVDLEDIKFDVHIALYQNLIDDVWEKYAARWVSEELAEQVLWAAERAQNHPFLPRTVRQPHGV